MYRCKLHDVASGFKEERGTCGEVEHEAERLKSNKKPKIL